MRVHLGGDHAAHDLLLDLVAFLEEQGHEVTNHGPHEYDALDDYPVFVLRAAEAVAADSGSFGVVLGGSGNGEQMAANKVTGIRAALAWSLDTAKLAREHNDAQVVALGGRQHTQEEGLEIVLAFLNEPFSGDERHVRRIAQIEEFERTGRVVGHYDAVTARAYRG